MIRILTAFAALLFVLPAQADEPVDGIVMLRDGRHHVIDYQIDPSYAAVARSVGCPPGWPDAAHDDPCSSPGAPTGMDFVSGADTGGLYFHDSSYGEMSGGTAHVATTDDDANLTISGGEVEIVASSNASVVRIVGGDIGRAYARDTATIVMTGGRITDFVVPIVFSTFKMSGGDVTGLGPSGFATADVSGGTVDTLIAAWFALATVTGGTIGSSVAVVDFGTIIISGGTMPAWFDAIDAPSLIAIVGNAFAVDGTPVPYGPLSAMTGRLTGTLASGDPLDSVFYQGGYEDEVSGLFSLGTIVLFPITACSDGLDNDGDGFTDYPDDPNCNSPAGVIESLPSCGLGVELALVMPLLMWRRRLSRTTIRYLEEEGQWTLSNSN